MAKLKEIQKKQKVIETSLVPFDSDGWSEVSGTSLTFTKVQRDYNNGRPFSNLYASFNLPSTSGQVTTYNETFIDSGMSALSQDNVIVVSIADGKYGELIDGRTIKFDIPTNTGITTAYSSYYVGKPFSSDNSPQASYFGNPRILGNVEGDTSLASTNIAFLFADKTKQPVNEDITNWSDGWIKSTPNGYVGANTDTFKFTTNSTSTPKAHAETADMPIGICYLDKGFMVITEPSIVSNFVMSAGTEDGTTTYSGNTSGFTNLYFTGDSKATATLTFSDKPNETTTITLIDAAGTSKTFETDNDGDGAAGSNIACDPAANSGPGMATELFNEINGESSLGITATNPSSGVLTLTQDTATAAGNTTITTNMNNVTGDITAFTGGADLPLCEFYSFEKEWVLTINIIADSGEFYITENQTASESVAPYYGAGGSDTGMKFKTPFGEVNKIWDISKVGSTFITEVGLYDSQNRLLAIAKPDRPIEKPKNTQVTLTLKMKF